ncbi:MAG: SRPBCC family protein [Proteobacteria bacterium]|nr:SRPBCC family protein [Pseudomonadota bacterium]
MRDRIEKRLELNAPVSRVWRALTDHREFGEWFHVKLDGPFVVGEISHGQITHPGYEHVRWQATVQEMEHERIFSFSWRADPVEPDADYSQESPTLVEFRLARTKDGTLLLLTESGFENILRERCFDAFRKNDSGWSQQMMNIERHVGQRSQ